MNWDKYDSLFNEILEDSNPKAPYDNKDFVEYVKLNQSRQRRWFKKIEINEELSAKIKSIDSPQNWVVISEPWCGDAAHIVPVIKMIADINPLINLEIQLRDSGSEIDSYLTNGGKSIPKLIVRENNQDKFVWGPRPQQIQKHVLASKEDQTKTAQEKKAELQQIYNKDKGQLIQQEIFELFG